MAKRLKKAKTQTGKKRGPPKVKKAGAQKRAAAKKAPAKKSRAAAKTSRASGVKRKTRKTAAKTAAGKKRSIVTSRKKSPKAGDKRKYRALLMHLREHITGQINFLATDNLSRNQNDAELNFRSEEQGTDNYDRDFALSRVSLEQNAIFEIDEALHRIETGAYGICEGCEKSIEKARLTAIPYSRMCVSCQSAAETSGGKSRTPDAAVFRDIDTIDTDTDEDNED